MIDHLVVFIKSPRLGMVKTRLAKDVGAEQALSIYQWLIEYTLIQVDQVDADLHLYFNEIPVESSGAYRLQEGNNLGERMRNALMDFQNKGPVVLIGSDCPEMEPKIIEEAFEALKNNDVVLGPALDGGFYLIGINQFLDNIFRDVEWGGATVLENVLQNLNHKSVHQLPILSDLDNVEDFKKFEQTYLKYLENKSIFVETEN